MPVVLIIDPITGQKMRSWNGMVQPERLLEVNVMVYIVCSQLSLEFSISRVPKKPFHTVVKLLL